MSWRVISIVACCHSVKLCALAAWTFRSQQQARLQDLAAGGAKKQEGPKTRRGAHFKNTVLNVCSKQGVKREMGGTDFKWGGSRTTDPPAGDDPAQQTQF